MPGVPAEQPPHQTDASAGQEVSQQAEQDPGAREAVRLPGVGVRQTVLAEWWAHSPHQNTHGWEE